MCSFSKKIIGTFAKIKNLKKQTNKQWYPILKIGIKGSNRSIPNHQSATLKPLTHPPIMV
jgi:hypothetical protein